MLPLLLGLTVLSACGDHSADIQRHLAKARQEISRRRYEPATKELDALLKLDPAHVDARILKAEIAYNREDLSAAESLLGGLQMSGSVDFRVGLGLAMVRKDQGDFKAALAHLETVPPANRPAMTWAEILSGAGKNDEAARILSESLAANPWDDAAPYLLSRIQAKRGKAESSKTWADHHKAVTKQREAAGRARGLEFQGADLQAAVLRTSTWFEAGRWLPAIELIKGMLKTPNPPRPALLVLGRILTKMGQRAAAQKVLNRARSGEDPEVAAMIEALTKLSEKPPKSLVVASDTQLKAGDAASARALLLLAAEDKPPDPNALKAIVKTFTQPTDVFFRVRALRQLRTLTPGDETLAAGLQAAGRELGVEFR